MPESKPSAGIGPFVSGLLKDWGIALVVVLVAFALWNQFLSPSPPSKGPAPDFTLMDLESRTVTLSEAGDGPVILNFWFTTCGPCRAEIPELAAFHAAHPEIPLYGISVDEGMATKRLGEISKRLGVTYPVLHDVELRVSRRYGVSLYPTTFVLRDGQIEAVKMGALTREGLEALLSR